MAGFLTSFLRRVEEQPEGVQFTFVSQDTATPCTVGHLFAAAQRYAAAYRMAGARQGQIVLISLRPSLNLYYAFLGALFAGCVPSMMPFASGKQDAGYFWRSHDVLVRHLGGGLFVTDANSVQAVIENITPGLLTVMTPEQCMSAQPDTYPPYDWAPDEICALQHSSGTTGLKKGIALTSREIELQAKAYAHAIDLHPDDGIASWLPLYHDMGFVATLLMPLIFNNHVAVMSPFLWLLSPLSLFDMIETYGSRYTWLPNFAFNHLVNSADGARPRDLSRMKAFINSSEPCKPASFDAFLKHFTSWGVRQEQLQVSYGMAESVFIVTHTRPSHPLRRIRLPQSARETGQRADHDAYFGEILSTGAPLDGISIRIAGEPGGIGEIQLRGDFVFNGYYKQDSAACFDDGWYKTGDIGFLQDGELFVLGRRNDMLIIYGKNFFAHELEALMSEVPGVKPGRVVVVGVFSERLGSEEAVVIAELTEAADPKMVRSAIKLMLNDNFGLVPARIVLKAQGWLVKSTSGKVSRHENLRKYLQEGVVS